MIIEQIKKKIQHGDYNTLGEMLDITPAAAKMRFLRGDNRAQEAVIQIIENRSSMIQAFRLIQRNA